MKHRIYQLLMTVLPIFCGSLATGALFLYLTQGNSGMSPIIDVLVIIAGIGTGVRNIWALIIMSEKNK